MAPKASGWIKPFELFIKDLRIVSKEGGKRDDRGTLFSLWESQRRFLQQMAEGLDDGIRIFYFLKGRQLGITTVSLAIDVFWLAMHPDTIGAMVTDTEANREKNRAVMRSYIQSFPPGYFGDDFYILKGRDNIKSMAFSNGSRMDFKVAGTKRKSSAWAEGEGYMLAHLTEIANFADSDGLSSFEESFAQTNPNRLFIYESTAKGVNNPWYDRWMGGISDPLTKRSYFLGWWSGDNNRIERGDPRYVEYGKKQRASEEREQMNAVKTLYDYDISQEQLAWYRWKEATTSGPDSMMFVQNNPWTADNAFVMTGFSFFPIRQLGRDLKRLFEEPNNYQFSAYRYELGTSFFDMRLEYVSEDYNAIELKVWEEPVEDGRYVIGFDPAWGRNPHKDSHCIEVWRCFADVLVQVAEYKTHDVEVKRAVWVLAHLAGAYRDCIINVELSGPGRMVIPELESMRSQLRTEINAERIRSTGWEDALSWARWYLYHRPDSIGSGYLNCFEMTWRTKSVLMHQMKGEYITNDLVIMSDQLLKEMQNVRVEGDQIGAPESRSEDCKDDTVFASALAIRAWLDWRRPEMMAHGLTRQRVIDEAQGNVDLVTKRMNNVVYRFLQTMEEQAQEPEIDPTPPWRLERGLH